MKIHQLAELFPLMDGAALAALADDVRAHGLREPIVLLDGAILDGRNRHRACEIAGVAPRFREFDGGDPIAYVLSLNLARRHLNDSQRAMIAARLANMRRGNPGKAASLQVSRADAAQKLHVSERSIADAAKVRANAAPEMVRAVDEGKLAVSAAAKAVKLPVERQREIAEQAEAGDGRAAQALLKPETVAASERAVPAIKFGVIHADPEWASDGGARELGGKGLVASLAGDDCVLFLWATAPKLVQALDAMSALGFVYRSHAVWQKDRTGRGHWFRDKHELLLLGTRGKIQPPTIGAQWASVIEAPAGDLSAKPETFLDLIERYFPRLAKIDLNRRGPPRPGWSAWGCEVEGIPMTGTPLESVAAGEPVWRREARRMREGGVRIIDIAVALGRSPSTVHGALKRGGKAGSRRAPAG